jgi:UDP-glucose:glycoprotein glucosyltransferase
MTADRLKRDASPSQLVREQSNALITTDDADGGVPIRLVAVVTPHSKSGQRLASILEPLSELDRLISIQVILNTDQPPQEERLKDLPLKRFYRFHLATEPRFNSKGSLIKPTIRFPYLPPDAMLTLGTEVPQAWVVMPVDSPHDLDNIRLRDIAEGHVSAQLELKYVLVEGHAFDNQSGQPPRGLQFALRDGQRRQEFDTIVMDNLGYFQLKANPGVWNLRIREGRSADFYRLVSLSDRPVSNSEAELYLYSFEGLLLLPKVCLINLTF